MIVKKSRKISRKHNHIRKKSKRLRKNRVEQVGGGEIVRNSFFTRHKNIKGWPLSDTKSLFKNFKKILNNEDKDIESFVDNPNMFDGEFRDGFMFNFIKPFEEMTSESYTLETLDTRISAILEKQYLLYQSVKELYSPKRFKYAAQFEKHYAEFEETIINKTWKWQCNKFKSQCKTYKDERSCIEDPKCDYFKKTIFYPCKVKKSCEVDERFKMLSALYSKTGLKKLNNFIKSKDFGENLERYIILRVEFDYYKLLVERMINQLDNIIGQAHAQQGEECENICVNYTGTNLFDADGNLIQKLDCDDDLIYDKKTKTITKKEGSNVQDALGREILDDTTTYVNKIKPDIKITLPKVDNKQRCKVSNNDQRTLRNSIRITKISQIKEIYIHLLNILVDLYKLKSQAEQPKPVPDEAEQPKPVPDEAEQPTQVSDKITGKKRKTHKAIVEVSKVKDSSDTVVYEVPSAKREETIYAVPEQKEGIESSSQDSVVDEVFLDLGVLPPELSEISSKTTGDEQIPSGKPPSLSSEISSVSSSETIGDEPIYAVPLPSGKPRSSEELPELPPRVKPFLCFEETCPTKCDKIKTQSNLYWFMLDTLKGLSQISKYTPELKLRIIETLKLYFHKKAYDKLEVDEQPNHFKGYYDNHEEFIECTKWLQKIVDNIIPQMIEVLKEINTRFNEFKEKYNILLDCLKYYVDNADDTDGYKIEINKQIQIIRDKTIRQENAYEAYNYDELYDIFIKELISKKFPSEPIYENIGGRRRLKNRIRRSKIRRHKKSLTKRRYRKRTRSRNLRKVSKKRRN